MEKPIYLALYKGHKTGRKMTAFLARLSDWLTRKLTRGSYSHCEIAIKSREQWGQYDHCEVYQCYSASIRDGGVRTKQIDFEAEQWDLIPLDSVSEAQIQAYFELTKGKKYDWWGAIGVVLGIKHKRNKFFCSEWCFNAIKNSDQGWRFSPNDLAVICQNVERV